MEPGNVVFYNPQHPSFSWGKGLFVILEIRVCDEYTEIRMCKIRTDDPQGLELFDDGRCMVTCIGSKCPDITVSDYLKVDISGLKW